MRQVFLYPGEDGYWVVECPSLPGCISQGRTRAEALANIRERLMLFYKQAAHLDAEVRDGRYTVRIVLPYRERTA